MVKSTNLDEGAEQQLKESIQQRVAAAEAQYNLTVARRESSTPAWNVRSVMEWTKRVITNASAMQYGNGEIPPTRPTYKNITWTEEKLGDDIILRAEWNVFNVQETLGPRCQTQRDIEKALQTMVANLCSLAMSDLLEEVL